MAIFSVEICRERVNMWLAAEEAVALGQEYQLGTKRLTRANLQQIREELEYWSARLAEAKAEEESGGRGGRNRVWGIVPRDV